ncbi:hypothetical protein PFICI_07355 [Pestalotiopsis fici W106-1]|uniref:Xylanolytic transcriptional activator regulatory domain-containing protein n=1 Tax=Pestalotiopsis fici (strain W106-1 / CGMCC3.15140) TaxID=1229662 RepID=W3X3U1_PESFW|nr:uncharacterized protein PFICI_07355 [Pestalotiopsis fici W106-1]ETS79826.1 hypothetical protein PFICI_07355 [Pestalotiopsis fici W106-1]
MEQNHPSAQADNPDSCIIASTNQKNQRAADGRLPLENSSSIVSPTSQPPTQAFEMDPSEMYSPMNASSLAGVSYSNLGSMATLPSGMERDDPSFVFPQVASAPGLQLGISTPGPESHPNDSDGDITNLLAARMGSLQIAEDGQLRYYGPTSNLHVHHSGFQSLSRSHIRHVATEGSEVLKRHGLDQDVPPELELYLAKLYFTWEDPAIHVVDEETFFTEKRKWMTEKIASCYYSETLNNAICAIGANLAAGEDFAGVGIDPEFFSSRAKALLDIEMDSPNVATVQALVIMSASEAAFTRDARGWLYSGMAVRLSADLGLHMDVTKHRESGLLSQHDVEMRSIAFWGVFIHDNMWSLYLGRPWGIGMRDITVSRPPTHLDESIGRSWSAFPAIGNDMPKQEIFFPLESCTDANIILCEFMRRINTTLYSGCTVAIDTLLKFLIKTKHELMNWLENIPARLRIDVNDAEATYIPAILQLHMQFYATLISLYRPYLSSQIFRYCQAASSLDDRVVISGVMTDCIAAANHLSEILKCYQKLYPLRRTNIQIVHIIFTGCLVFVYDICTRSGLESQSSLRNLRFCCHALGDIGQIYGNATRALEVIILIKAKWQQLARARPVGGLSMKRPSFSISADGQQERGQGQEGDRAKRHHGYADRVTDAIESSVFTLPPAPSSFQSNQHHLPRGNINIEPPGVESNFYDAWQLLDSTEYNIADMNPSIGGLDEQTLQDAFASLRQDMDHRSLGLYTGASGKEASLPSDFQHTRSAD